MIGIGRVDIDYKNVKNENTETTEYLEQPRSQPKY